MLPSWSEDRVKTELVSVSIQYTDFAVLSSLICVHIEPTIRHSSIRDFLIKKFSVYSPIEPWHKTTTRV